jgi:hypothetical protein
VTWASSTISTAGWPSFEAGVFFFCAANPCTLEIKSGSNIAQILSVAHMDAYFSIKERQAGNSPVNRRDAESAAADNRLSGDGG